MSGAGLVPRDQLVGDVVEVVADDLRLRTDAKHVIAGALDQRSLPARGHRAERVPGVAGGQGEIGGLCATLALDIAIGLARRLVVLDAVGAEAALELIDDAAMLE